MFDHTFDSKLQIQSTKAFDHDYSRARIRSESHRERERDRESKRSMTLRDSITLEQIPGPEKNQRRNAHRASNRGIAWTASSADLRRDRSFLAACDSGSHVGSCSRRSSSRSPVLLEQRDCEAAAAAVVSEGCEGASETRGALDGRRMIPLLGRNAAGSPPRSRRVSSDFFFASSRGGANGRGPAGGENEGRSFGCCGSLTVLGRPTRPVAFVSSGQLGSGSA